MIKNLIAFVITVFLLVSGQALWKIAASQVREVIGLGNLLLRISTNLPFLIGCAFYVCASALWIYLLGQYDYSKIYPIFVGSCIIFSMVVGILFFNENIAIMHKLIGSLLILGGIVIIASI